MDFSAYTWSDVNGDGFYDAGQLDSDGDGYYDTIAIDADENGIVDGIGQDLDGNGVNERIWVDEAGDGAYSTLAIDTDQDGVADAIYRADGSVTYPASTDAILGNTYVGGGTTNPLLGLPDSAYTDPVTGPLISNILTQQAITSEIWALPDNMTIEYRYDSF